MKFTLKCVYDEYDNFTGDVIGTNDVITHEFHEIGLEEVLEKIELFLLGVGFKFDGNLEIVKDHDESFNMSFDDYDEWRKSNGGTNDQSTKCPICTIDKTVMKDHECFDKTCPKDTW